MVEAVVDVAGGVGAVGDSGDIAACIVSVGVGRAAGRPLINLRAGGGRSGILVRDAGVVGEIFLCEEAVEEKRIPPTVSSLKGNCAPREIIKISAGGIK